MINRRSRQTYSSVCGLCDPAEADATCMPTSPRASAGVHGNIEQSAERKSILQRNRNPALPAIFIQAARIFRTYSVPGKRWPLRWPICRQSTADRINAESKETIELWMKAFQSKRTIAEKVPIERFKCPM